MTTSEGGSLAVHDTILGTLGNTPLVRLNRVTSDIKAQLIAKVEFFNPAGSVKDGVGLAIAAAIKGYKCIFVLADKQSEEKRSLLRAYGARVVVCPTAVEPDDPRSYYSVARRLAEETPNAVLAGQYWNPANPE